MAAYKKPFHTLRSGGMKAAIWLNDGIKGPFFSTTFSRSFKDRTGAWRNASSFGFSDHGNTVVHPGLKCCTWS